MTTERTGGTQRIGTLAEKVVSKPVSGPTSKQLPVSFSDVDFARAMLILCALKRTADLTTPQLESWYAVLCGFRLKTVHRAILTVCASQERFPELSDVFQACRKIEPRERPYNPHGDGTVKPLYEDELTEIAGRLGLEV